MERKGEGHHGIGFSLTTSYRVIWAGVGKICFAFLLSLYESEGKDFLVYCISYILMRNVYSYELASCVL